MNENNLQSAIDSCQAELDKARDVREKDLIFAKYFGKQGHIVACLQNAPQTIMRKEKKQP